METESAPAPAAAQALCGRLIRDFDSAERTRDQPEVVAYPDSDKYLRLSDDGTAQGCARMHHGRDDLDDWDGEP